MPATTRKAALEFMRSFVGKPRSEMPWLKGRPKLYDCAAGYSYAVLGTKTKIVWVHELVDKMKANKTWTKKGTPKPGDAVIYDWNGDGGCDHVAMFHSVNKAGQFVCFGADQGKPTPGKVTKLVTGKGVILGWGTPFKFAEPTAPETVVPADNVPETPVAEMPLKPEHYAPSETAPAPVVAPETVVAPIGFVDLKKGSKGAGVKKLQTALKIGADGIFGPITEEAVKAYQKKKGIVITGIANEETWKRLGL